MGDRLATIVIGRKVGGCCALCTGELGSHLTQCGLSRGLPRYQVASWSIQPFAAIHQRYRETGEAGQRSRGIGRTVTCNGRQNQSANGEVTALGIVMSF